MPPARLILTESNDEPEELKSLRKNAELARRMAGNAEILVQARMTERMEFSQRVAKLKALGTESALAVVATIEAKDATADEDVRALVDLSSHLSALGEQLEPLAEQFAANLGSGDAEAMEAMQTRADNLEKQVITARQQVMLSEQRATEAQDEARRAIDGHQDLEKVREEVSGRAGELLAQLSRRDARVAELEKVIVELNVELDSTRELAPVGGDPVPDASHGQPANTGQFRLNPLIKAEPRLANEKYAGRASARLRELLVEEPHHFNDLVDLTGLPRAEVADCIESFVALGVASVEA